VTPGCRAALPGPCPGDHSGAVTIADTMTVTKTVLGGIPCVDIVTRRKQNGDMQCTESLPE
jgi:hypothetical protein